MQAFLGRAEVKDWYVRQMREHRQAGKMRRGTWWNGNAGCAVGCAIHSGNVSFYEILLGIPSDLALLQACLFDTLPRPFAYDWAVAFLEAIPIGANLTGLSQDIAIWIARHHGKLMGSRPYEEDDAPVVCWVYMDALGLPAWRQTSKRTQNTIARSVAKHVLEVVAAGAACPASDPVMATIS
jgi:hypothetical protein